MKILIPVVYFIFHKINLVYTLSHNFQIFYNFFVLCQMSKNFGKWFGPSTRDLSFRLRCSSFLLSNFASQLNLIQSVVRVGILGICVASSILRVLLSGFWTSGSQIPSPRDPVPGSWVSGSCILGPQSPRSLSPAPWSQVSELQGLESQGPGSGISGPDFRLSHVLLTD